VGELRTIRDEIRQRIVTLIVQQNFAQVAKIFFRSSPQAKV
jgi:hypothetical protein